MKLLIVGLSIILFFAIKKSTAGWLSPARISSLVWTIQIIGYTLFSTEIKNVMGIFYLLLCSLIFAIGESASKRFTVVVGTHRHNIDYKIGDSAWLLLLFFIFLGIVKNVITISRYGFNISNFTSVASFLDMNTSMAYQRYYGNNSTSTVESILSTFIYLAPLYGGYIFLSARNTKGKIICLFSIVPAIITVLSQNTKLVLLDSMFFFFVGYSIAYLYYSSDCFKINSKVLFILCGVGLIVFTLFFISMCAKIGGFDSRTVGIVREKIVVYAFGSIEAFSAWFAIRSTSFSDVTFGVNTFLAPFDFLHIVERSQGVYDSIPGVASNIFTGYRALIQDFTAVGSLFVVFIAGTISGVFYRKVKARESTVISRTLYGCFLFTCLHYWLGSPWVYTSLWLTFILFGVVISMSGIRLRMQRKALINR